MRSHPLGLLSLALAFPFSASVAPAAETGGLKGQVSSYLQQHQDDAISWMPWGEAAFARAKTEKKAFYVCIGATTSELTRAMHKQSFVNPQIVSALNNDFVCVLVDRDENIAVGTLFQTYLQATKQISGWPVNVWLTPELKPFEGSTYLPPSEEWGKEGILNVIKRVTEEWKTSPDTAAQKAGEAVSTTLASEYFELGPDFAPDTAQAALQTAIAARSATFDSAHGGFGEAPRFSEAELLRAMIRAADGPARDAALSTLRAIDRGALHDPLDGGFFRRSIDGAWEYPSFQKFLGDQARIALAALDAAKVSGDEGFNKTVRTALDYALGRLASSRGGYIHAEDASSEETSLNFGWTQSEITSVLGEKLARDLAASYGIKPEGNVSAENDAGAKWKGRNLLFLRNAPSDPAAEARLAPARAKLLALRDSRTKVVKDENVLIGENGLFLAALSRAASQLKEPRYLEQARKLTAFLQAEGCDTKAGSVRRLAHSETPGGPEDYAFVALGLAEAASALDQPALRTEAQQLLAAQQNAFFDANTGRFYATRAGQSPELWMRPHSLDPAPGEMPSAESATVLALLTTGATPSTIPAPLLRGLTALLNDANTPPRGDVLFAVSELIESSRQSPAGK